MKWMLVIVVIISADDVSHSAILFESKAACAAAGEAFVDRFPGFEWADPRDETAIETPVVRQQVRCVPAGDGVIKPTSGSDHEPRVEIRPAERPRLSPRAVARNAS